MSVHSLGVQIADQRIHLSVRVPLPAIDIYRPRNVPPTTQSKYNGHLGVLMDVPHFPMSSGRAKFIINPIVARKSRIS